MRPPMGGKVEKEACRPFHSAAIFREWLTPIITVKARFTDDTLLIRKPHYWGQFWKKSLCIFSKFNPLNTDTFYDPKVSVLTGFDYATLAFRRSFYLWSSNAFQNRRSCEDNRRAENWKIFGALGCIVHCNSILVFVPSQSQSPVFTKWHFL